MITYFIKSLDVGQLFILAGLLGLAVLAVGYGLLSILNRWLS